MILSMPRVSWIIAKTGSKAGTLLAQEAVVALNVGCPSHKRISLLSLKFCRVSGHPSHWMERPSKDIEGFRGIPFEPRTGFQWSPLSAWACNSKDGAITNRGRRTAQFTLTSIYQSASSLKNWASGLAEGLETGDAMNPWLSVLKRSNTLYISEIGTLLHYHMAHPTVIGVLWYHLISFMVFDIFDPNLSAAEEGEEGTLGENQVWASTSGKTLPSSSEPWKFKVSKGRGMYIYVKNTQIVKLGYKWVSTVQGINGSHCRSQLMPGLEIFVEDILGRIFLAQLSGEVKIGQVWLYIWNISQSMIRDWYDAVPTNYSRGKNSL